jgi:crossover junction endodeoxyribonuclease RusA
VIVLPYPNKALWPNGRPHPLAKHRETKKHREWARLATLAALSGFRAGESVQWSITVYPKPRGPLPDKDNTLAAMKAYQDGIADALGVNDRAFETPTLHFAERTATGGIVVVLA